MPDDDAPAGERHRLTAACGDGISSLLRGRFGDDACACVDVACEPTDSSSSSSIICGFGSGSVSIAGSAGDSPAPARSAAGGGTGDHIQADVAAAASPASRHGDASDEPRQGGSGAFGACRLRDDWDAPTQATAARSPRRGSHTPSQAVAPESGAGTRIPSLFHEIPRAEAKGRAP